MITFTQVFFTHRSLVCTNPADGSHPLSIGNVLRFTVQVTTDKVAPELGTFYLRNGNFLSPIYTGEQPNSVPPNPYYALVIDATTVVAGTYPMSFNGVPNTEQLYNVQLTHSIIAGFWTLTITGDLLILEDNLGYPQVITNNRRLYYNNKSNTTKLTTYGDDVYTKIDRVFRLALWHQDTANVFSFTRLDRTQGLRWYDKGTQISTQTDITGAVTTLYRNANQVTDLSTTQDTELKFTYNSNVATQTYAMIWLVKDDNMNNLDDLPAIGIAGQSVRFITTLALSSPLPVGNVPTYLAGGTALWSPSTAPSVGTGLKTAACFVRGNELLANQKYRFVAVVFVEDALTGTYSSYSFVSPFFIASTLPAPCPPAVVGNLVDYYDTYSNNLEVTPMERIQSRVQFLGGFYEVCRGFNAWFTNIRSITIRMFTIDGNYKHILNELTATRNGGNWISPSTDFTLTDDPTLVTTTIRYLFRVRYEANVANQATFDILNNTFLTNPTSNQDWRNKVITIETIARLANGGENPFDEEYIFTQKIRVVEFDNLQPIPQLTVQVLDLNDNPIMQLCDTTQAIKLLTTNNTPAAPPDSALHIAMTDKTQYGIQNITEFDPVVSPQSVPMLQQLPVTATDSDFAGNDAETLLSVSQLNSNTKYRFASLRFRQCPPIPCSNEAQGIIALMNAENALYLLPDVPLGEQNAICEAVTELINCGVWSKLSSFVLPNSFAPSSTINWKRVDPNTTCGNLILNSTGGQALPEFIPRHGWYCWSEGMDLVFDPVNACYISFANATGCGNAPPNCYTVGFGAACDTFINMKPANLRHNFLSISDNLFVSNLNTDHMQQSVGAFYNDSHRTELWYEFYKGFTASQTQLSISAPAKFRNTYSYSPNATINTSGKVPCNGGNTWEFECIFYTGFDSDNYVSRSQYAGGGCVPTQYTTCTPAYADAVIHPIQPFMKDYGLYATRIHDWDGVILNPPNCTPVLSNVFRDVLYNGSIVSVQQDKPDWFQRGAGNPVYLFHAPFQTSFFVVAGGNFVCYRQHLIKGFFGKLCGGMFVGAQLTLEDHCCINNVMQNYLDKINGINTSGLVATTCNMAWLQANFPTEFNTYGGIPIPGGVTKVTC